MKGIWKKLLSILLALTLVLQMMPVQAIATELQESEDLTLEEDVTTTESTEDATIVAEIPSGRDEFQKEFVLSNGLRMISIHGAAVHYEEDGEWKEIDNTLQPISSTGAVLNGKAALTSAAAYKNTAGLWDVKLPASLHSGSAVEVSKDGYTLSFQFAGELHNNHVVILISATGKIVSSPKFLPEVLLPAADTFANAVWSEAALTSIGQTIAQGGLMVGINLSGAIGNALYERKQDALYVLYPE